jgi:transcriptional regulator with XRE-family HTH domain
VRKRSTTKSTRLSRKLKLIRSGLGLSQSEILDRLGFSESLFRSNISQYERGARVPSPKVLLQYSRLAKIDLAVLIDDDVDLPERFTSVRKIARKK